MNTARECGDCRVCCTLFEIAEVNKGLNRPCRHQSGPGEPGCKIYGHRPQVCREFECAWKQGLSGEGDRPDRLGIMLYTVQLEDGGPGLAIVEATPGAFEKPRVREMISIYQNRKPGRIILRRAEDRRQRYLRHEVAAPEGSALPGLLQSCSEVCAKNHQLGVWS